MTNNLTPLNIIIADGCPDNRALISDQLRTNKTQQYNFIELSTGKQVIEYINSNIDNLPDCMLLDSKIHGVNSSEVLKFLSQEYKEIPLPVIILLAESTVEDNEDFSLAKEAINLGAQDYIIKTSLRPAVLSRTIHNAIERFRLTGSLRDKEMKHSLATDAVDLGTWGYNSHTKEFHCSKRCHELMNAHDKNELSYEDFINYIHEDDKDKIHQLIKEALEKPAPHDFRAEYKIKLSDNDSRWISLRGRTNLDGKKNTALLGTILDVTERKRSDIERERFFNVGLDIMLVCDFDGYILKVNRAFTETLGWEQDQVIGKQWMEFVHPDDINRSNDKAEEIYLKPTSWSIDQRYIHKNGTYRWLNWSGQSYPSERLLYCAATDITTRKETEEALRTSEERLNMALDASQSIATWNWDIINDKVYADARFANFFNLSPAQVALGVPVDSFTDAIHAEDAPLVIAAIERSLEIGGSFEMEYRIQNADKSVRWVLAKGRANKNKNGELVNFPGAAVDITERKQREERQAVMASLSQTIMGLDNTSCIVHKASEILGKTMDLSRAGYGRVDPVSETVIIEQDWVSEGEMSIIGTHHFREYGSFIDDLQNGKVVVINDLNTDPSTKDKIEKIKSINVASIINLPLMENGKLSAIIFIHDKKPRKWSEQEISFAREVGDRTWAIAERVRVLEALKFSESKWRVLAEAMPQLVWIANVEGEVIYLNSQWGKYSGRDESTLLGNNWLETVHSDDKERVVTAWANALSGIANYDLDYRIKSKAGEYKWFRVRAVPIYNNESKIVRWYGTCTDIEEIVEARDAAQAANIAKSEFLANMSHEIRTPMNAIIGLSNILGISKPLTEQQKNFVETLQSSADSLLALINDLLDISKIEARTVELESIPFSLYHLLQQIISMMSVRAREKNLAFTMDAECTKNRGLVGDPTRVRQIIVNLCSNAIKFTESGSIHIKVTCQKIENTDLENIKIEVLDTGIGIEGDKHDRIFDKFTQADNSINRKYGGTGLGLTITKTLVELMGGTIKVESDFGKGSNFIIDIPMKIEDIESEAKAAECIASQENDPLSPKVLLVEDYGPNVLVATTFLECFGFQYDTASNGKEALEKIKDNNYFAILMDVQMYGMNGFDTTKAIRKIEADNDDIQRLHIIGMTAHALAGDRERCISSGMDDYLPKPFEPDELKEKLSTALQDHIANDKK